MRFLRPTFLGVCGWLLSPSSALCQTPQAFEVASIKLNRSGSLDSNINSLPGGRTIVTNETVRNLIRLAFGVKDYQIARAPGWIGAERYDIEAKTASPPGGPKLETEQELLRALLADRFQLSTHRESKEGNVYLLVVAKGGPKLTRDEATGSATRTGCGRLTGRRLTMDTVATVLSRQFERDVINRTGLPGKYSFQLDWTPDSGVCPAADGEQATPRPSVFTAIQEQLGLKLEPAKGPVETLVIDRVERPSGN
jgi:uncharacterized protein (TIGR03435 family)